MGDCGANAGFRALLPLIRKEPAESNPGEDRFKRFVHRDCEFWPCHQMEKKEWRSCLFCYCPLYLLECDGNYEQLPSGMKDCSGCTLPHEEGGWERVTDGIGAQLFFSASASGSR